MAWEPIRKFLLIAYESGRKYWKWRKVKTWTSHRSFEISLCSFKWLWKNLNDQGSVGEALTQPTSPVFFTFFKNQSVLFTFATTYPARCLIYPFILLWLPHLLLCVWYCIWYHRKEQKWYGMTLLPTKTL